MNSSAARRPARTYRTSLHLRALRIASVLGALLITGWMLWEYRGLPEAPATHFGAAGDAEQQGHKSRMLWGSITMLATITLISLGSKHPAWLNYPFAITEQNAQQVYREGERTMIWVAVALLVLNVGLARDSMGASSTGVEIAGMLLLAAAVAIGSVRIIRAGRHR